MPKRATTQCLKIRHLHPVVFQSIFSLVLLHASWSWSSDSLIETALHSRESIVGVRAAVIDIHKNPRVETRIDKKTGRLLIARNVKAAMLEKEGAGVILHPSGLIVTNFHTINKANRVDVMLFDHTQLTGSIVRIMPEDDLALIKVETRHALKPITMADSNHIQLGDKVLNIGNSKFLHKTLSGGRVTGIGRSATGANVEIIQTNVNLYKGDSGGPLLDRDGHLIGMMAAKLKSPKRATLAIPSNKIKKLYIDFLK